MKNIIILLFAALGLFTACEKITPNDNKHNTTDTVYVTDTVVIHDTVCIETTKYMWTRLADFPFLSETDEEQLQYFTADQNIYAGGVGCETKFFRYDTELNEWTHIKNFPIIREEYFMFSVGSRGFVCSNFSSYLCGEWLPPDTVQYPYIWEYIPQTDQFIPIGRNGILTDMYTTMLIAPIGNYLLVKYDDNRMWLCNLTTNQWTQKQNYPFSNTPEIFFAINNRLYIVLANESNNTNNKTYEYNPDTDVWAEKSSFQGTQRRGANSFALNNKGYLYGGTYGNGHTDLRDMWQYNPATNQWQQLPDVPFTDTWNHSVVTIEDTAYIFDNNQTWKLTVEQSTKKIKQ